MTVTINIRYTSEESTDNLNLERRLSNLYPYKFNIDGIEVSSMEGFLQSLKTNDDELKETLWTMHGYMAWKYGQNIDWWSTQTLYWMGRSIRRQSDDYIRLITRAYDCLFSNEDFKDAIIKSLPYKIDHSIGKTNRTRTLLTKSEYLGQLERLRDIVRPKRKFFGLFGT